MNRLHDFEALRDGGLLEVVHRGDLEGHGAGGGPAVVAVEDAAGLSVERFVSQYERTRTPVLIKGLAEEAGWAMPHRWTLDRLLADYGNFSAIVGGDADNIEVGGEWEGVVSSAMCLRRGRERER